MPAKDQREYQRKWIAKRRADYLKDKKCVRCGSTEDLQLDHIEPGKKRIKVSSLWSMSDKNPRKIAELAKCQILCISCHKDKNREDRPVYHGTISGYRIGCRCNECKEANRIKQRNYRLRKLLD